MTASIATKESPAEETTPNLESRSAPVRLLVFDLDGTLIDSSTDLCNAVNAALMWAKRGQLSPLQITSFIGQGAATLMRRALAASFDVASPEAAKVEDLFDRVFQYFLEYYRDHKLDNTRAYPVVMEALQHLRSRHPHLPMAVLTNKPVCSSLEICAALGLKPFFFAIYGGDSFAKKPDPEGLLAIIQKANARFSQSSSDCGKILPESVVMIGDSDVDIQTARRCGVRSLGCSYGLAPEALRAAAPDLWSTHPSEWVDVLLL